jgi:hypothetical protein
MKIREVIQQFKHFAEDKSGFISDDIRFSEYAIFHHMLMARTTLINERKKMFMSFSNSMYQTLNCVNFEEVDKSECNLNIPSGCNVLKSTKPVPNFLVLVSINSRLGNEHLDIVDWDRVEGRANHYLPKISNSRFATFRNLPDGQYLYILNDLDLKQVTLEAIFENPIEADLYNGDETAKCSPMDLNSRTDYNLIDIIIKMTWDSLIRINNIAPMDVQNDDRNPSIGSSNN